MTSLSTVEFGQGKIVLFLYKITKSNELSATHTIRVSEETYNKLAKMGNLKDSFDTVLSRLLIQSGGNQ